MPAEPTEEGPVVHFGRICYRSTGLGVWGMMLRFGGMPLEKLALYMNSSQVSGNQMQQLRQAVRLTMAEGPLGPFRVVGRASMIAWFLQYSVMGFVFQARPHPIARCPARALMPNNESLIGARGVAAARSLALVGAGCAARVLRRRAHGAEIRWLARAAGVRPRQVRREGGGAASDGRLHRVDRRQSRGGAAVLRDREVCEDREGAR